MKIRTCRESDASHLKKWLLKDDILRWYPMHNEREVDDSVKIWINYAKMEAAFTAEIDGEPVGMTILYVQNLKKLAHHALFAIIVDENYRGRGIGKQMIEHLEKVGRKEFGITLLHLEVYKGNPAKRLYDRMGFVEYGVHPRFLKEPSGEYLDKILMQKPLLS